MNRALMTAAVLALALPAAAQSVPAANYTDMWWNPSESGWGVSFAQHSSHQVFAVWYTYDPRESTSSGRGKPLWFVVPGGTWTSPTRFTGTAYVTNGVPFNQGGSNLRTTPVGTFTFEFASASSGTFTYTVSPPQGVAANDPAFNLPALSGSKAIQRQSF
jgi:hypothetical protein